MTTEIRHIDHDIVKVFATQPEPGKSRGKLIATLFWGDQVRVTGQDADNWHVTLARREWNDAARRYEL